MNQFIRTASPRKVSAETVGARARSYPGGRTMLRRTRPGDRPEPARNSLELVVDLPLSTGSGLRIRVNAGLCLPSSLCSSSVDEGSGGRDHLRGKADELAHRRMDCLARSMRPSSPMRSPVLHCSAA